MRDKNYALGFDLTRRKQAEEALRESEERHRSILQTALDGYWLVDMQGHLLEVNDAYCRMSGYIVPELLTMRVTDLEAIETPGEVASTMQKVKADGMARFETRHRRKDGSLLDLMLGIQYRPVNEGQFVVFLQDITKRKQAEAYQRQSRRAALNMMADAVEARDRLEQASKDLQISEENYKKLFREMQSAFAHSEIICDAQKRPINSRYLAVNPAFERITGRKAENVVGKTMLDVFPALEPSWIETFGRVALTGEPEHFENQAAELDMTFDVSAFCPAPNQYACTFSDITERKQAEEKIMQLHTELEQRVLERTAQLEAANKELEAFSYSVSHDLRAPLRYINGYVELLNNRFGETLPDKAKHYLKTITESTKQMGTLIDDLLQFSRTGRQELRQMDMDINVLIQDVFEKFKPDMLNRNISWTVAELPKVFGDYSLLKQVWMNLLDNAIKYTRNKEEAHIEVGCTKESDHWVFFVRDNGVGFDMQYAHKLFGVFQRLHSSAQFEGTGIGLANVQRIVHKHGGRVWAEAQPDQGATFYFTIPRNTIGQGDSS